MPGLDKSKEWQPWVKEFKNYTFKAKEILKIKLPFLLIMMRSDKKHRVKAQGCEDLVATRGGTLARLFKGFRFGSSLEDWNTYASCCGGCELTCINKN